MLVLGIIENILGAIVPNLREDFGVNYTSIGYISLAAGFGYILTTLLGSLWSERFGQRSVIAIGIGCVALAILGTYASLNFIFLLLAMVIMNLGFGAMAIGANTLAPRIFIRKQALMMNLLHFFYGAGAIIGPRYAGQLLDVNISWREVYLYSLIFLSVVLLVFLVSKFPTRIKGDKGDNIPIGSVLRDLRFYLFATSLGFYVACEVGVARWFPNFLQEVHGFDKLSSTNYLSIFFTVFTIGRLLGGFVVEKLGYYRSTLGFLIISALLFALGISMGSSYAILISISGLFFSIVFPTIVAILVEEYPKGTSSVMGMAITASSLINMLGNYTIGKANDIIGVKGGFGLILIYFLITIVSLLLLSTKVTLKRVDK